MNLSDSPYELRACPHFDRRHTSPKDAIISHILKIFLHDLPPKLALLSPAQSGDNPGCCIPSSIVMSVPDGLWGLDERFDRQAGKNTLGSTISLRGFSHPLYPDYC